LREHFSEALAHAFRLADVALRRREVLVAGPLLDAQRVVSPDGHPRDPQSPAAKFAPVTFARTCGKLQRRRGEIPSPATWWSVAKRRRKAFMRKTILRGAAALCGMMLSVRTAVANPPLGWAEVGIRSGYALPFGDATGPSSGAGGGLFYPESLPLSDTTKGLVPIWIDAGYRFFPSMFVGAYFQYGFASVNKGKQPGCQLVFITCSVDDMMFGIDFQYHLMPDQAVDPWVGVGIGYEILHTWADQGGVGVGSDGNKANGFQFVILQVGADYNAMPFGIGPFATFSLGQFSYCSGGDNTFQQTCPIEHTALHEWLTFGIRGTFDIRL
jgi:hypothetical protein